MLLDKFESPMEAIKINCYQVLNRILIDGDLKIFVKNMPELWNIIKFDCLKRNSKSNLEISSYAENCLKLLTKVYSSDDEQIRKWFKMIINDLEACLFNLDLNCYLSSTATLSIIAVSYPKFFSTLSRLIVSNAIHNYKSNDDNSKYRIESLQSLYIFGEEIDKEKHFELDDGVDEFKNHSLLLSKVSQGKIQLLKDNENIRSVFDQLICFLFKILLVEIEIDCDERMNCLYTLKRIISMNFLNFDQELLDNYLNDLFKVIKTHLKLDQSLTVFSSILEYFNETNCQLVQQSLIPNILIELNSTSPVYFIKLLEFCSLTLDQERLLIDYSLKKLKNKQSFSDLTQTIGNTLKCHIKKASDNESFLDLFFNHLMQAQIGRAHV